MSNSQKLTARLKKGFSTKIVVEILRVASVPTLRLGAAFLQFIATIWIARILGQESSGEFFFWAAVLMSLGQTATFGLDGLSLQQIPRLKCPKEISNFLAPIRTIVICFSIILGLGTILYSILVQHETERSILWYSLLPLSLSGIALCRVNGEAMKGLSHPKFAIVYRQFAAGTLFLIGLLFFGKRLTPETALGCYAVSFGLVGIIAPFGPGFRQLHPAFQIPQLVTVSHELKKSWPIFLTAVFASMNYIIPLALLERMHPPESVSFLTTTYRIFMIFDLLALAVHSISMPQLSVAGHEKNWRLTGSIYQKTIKQSIAILGFPLIASIFLAAIVMSIFGEGFTDAAPLLRTFLIFAAISLLLGPANELVLMTGDTVKMAWFAVTRMILTVTISAILIPNLGSTGMALAIGTGIIVQKLLGLLYFRKLAVLSG